ncbi:MAG: HIT family protein [Sedimentisphaerales bacterium]|nr:HIT family protein [Sedimentisphaerales bacterium]
MTQTDCIFCKIVAGHIPCYKIFENDHVLAFLDIGPVSTGHTLLIPKNHIDRIDQCPPNILAETAKVLPQLARSVAAAVDAPAYNILCNNGSAAGQVVMHLHFHIIPRHERDGVFTQWPSFKYPEGKADMLCQKINENLKK